MPRLLRQPRIFSAHLRRVERGAGAEVPVDLERVAAELGRPEVVGDDGDAGGHLHHRLARPARPSPSVASKLFTLPPNTGDRATRAVFMPGICTSMPNCASPVTFSGESSRLVGLPMIFQSLRSFSVTCAGGVEPLRGLRPARRRTSFRRPWTTTKPFSARHALADASTAGRRRAPACRAPSPRPAGSGRTPTRSWSSRRSSACRRRCARRRARPGACSTRIFAQSQPSSSATSIGSVVQMP